jgi:hypothetical protein
VRIEMPPDETELDMIIRILKQGMHEEVRTDDMNQVEYHVVTQNGVAYATISFLENALKFTTNKISAKQIGFLLRRIGGMNSLTQVNGSYRRVWRVDGLQ